MSYLDKVAIGGTTYDIQDSKAVQFETQSLTDTQKEMARTNIGAASSGDLDKRTEAMTVLPSANCINPRELETGYISTTGSESSSASYKHTGHIAVNAGDVLTAWRNANNTFNTSVSSVNMRYICAYDADGNVLPSSGSGSAVTSYTVPVGVASVVVSIEAAYFAYDVAIYKQAITPTRITPYEPEVYGATPEFLPTNYQAKPGRFTLYQATYTTELLLPEINVTKQVNIAFSCVLGNEFTSLKVGNGVTDSTGATYNSFVTVTPTKAIFTINNNEYEFDHNLSIAGYIKISIHVRSDTKADVTVESGGGVYTRTIGWYGCGRDLYKARLVGSATECYFTVALLDINADTYAFGDSYMAIIESPERWPHWMINAGFGNNVLFNACPGENSSQAVKALQNIFAVGKPKYLLWALGMNDGADTDNATPNSTWKTYVDYVLMLCERYGITPILATIPTVPTINHEGKNAWIRASGYRYIDFAKAVGADGSGNWYIGPNLASDSQTLTIDHDGGYSGAITSVKFDGGTVAENSLVGKTIMINNVPASVTSNTTDTISFNSTNFGTISDNATIYPSRMLSTDSVHPTQIGAHALWNRVQIDFPEIMMLK